TNQCAYQVLESFDDLGLDPDDTTDQLLKSSPGLAHTSMVVDGMALQPMLDHAHALHTALPRSKAYDVVRLILDGKDTNALILKTLKKARALGYEVDIPIRHFRL